MKRLLYILCLCYSLFFVLSCEDADVLQNLKKDDPILTRKDYLSVLPSTVQVGNFAGTFKLNISTNLVWNASTDDEWIHLTKTEGGKEIFVVAYDENKDITSSRKASIKFLAKGINDVVYEKVVEIVQSDKTFVNPIAGIPDPWIIQYQGAYYTCKAHGDGINVSKSDKLTVINSTESIWKAPKDNGSIKPWNTSHVWAPELHFIDGRWYVYYAAGDYTQGLLTMLESNVKTDRNDLDLLFGCLLEWGLPLSMPYKSEKIEGCRVHTYNEGDLIACFDENIPDSVVKEIAKRQPLRAVFRDGSFKDSPSKINVGEIFKMLAPDTRVKVI